MNSFYNSLPKMLTIVFVFTVIQISQAQTRYKDIVFSNVTSTKDIQFGRSLAISGSNSNLYLDLYEPADDTLSSRPLVICIHGGSLTTGLRNEMASACIDLAKRGFVAATIDYRLGIESPKGVTTISEALLRGVQDAKAAVRFFRSQADVYGIDTSKIYLEGSSAGAMIAVHYAYWDQDEITSDVNQSKWGDIEGTSGNPGYSSEIKGIVNYYGAILDPEWIDPGEVPVANFNGLLDVVVPADSGVSIDFGIEIFGGITISRIATALGIYNHALFPETGHGGSSELLPEFSSNFLYSLMVLSSSTMQDFSSMDLTEDSLKVFRYDNYTFQTTAIDKFGNRIILPASMVEYSCDSRIGSITSYGLFTPAELSDSGYVYAEFNDTIDSCFVKTYDLSYFVINPKLGVTDKSRPLKISIDTYDADSVKQDLAITNFDLISTNPSVGTIDSKGIFTGQENGTTNIIATCSGYSDTSVIKVEIASGFMSFDSLETLSGWTFTGENLDSLSVTLVNDQKSVGNESFKIDYKLTYDSQNLYYMIYLNKDLTVYGIPDSIFLDVKSDGRNHKLFYRYSDTNQGIFRAFGKKYLNDSTAFDRVHAPMTGLTQLAGNSELTYPLTLKRIEIQLAGDKVQGTTTSGTIYVDNLKLKYPGGVTSVEETLMTPDVFRLEQNYPNPFNPNTVISFNLVKNGKVSLKIYDILGREVAVLLEKEFNPGFHSLIYNASGLSSGVYFYKLQTDDRSVVKKMLLLK